jgi:hypothetical protein
MESPLRRAPDPLDPDAVFSPSPGPFLPVPVREQASKSTDDLARLTRSVELVQRECAVVVLAAGGRLQKPAQKLPRAAQLAPVPGLSDADATPTTVAAAQTPEVIPFHRAPPLAMQRPCPPPPQRRRTYRVRGALYLLVAGLIAASLAYHVAAGGLSAWMPAYAASASHR